MRGPALLLFTLRRILISIPVLLASSLIVYVLVGLSGDPRNLLYTVKPVPTAEIRFLTQRLHLDENIFARWFHWLIGVLHGDFGYSQTFHDHIGSELYDRFGTTLKMILAALVLAAVFAIITGVISAVRQYTVTDYSFTLVGFLFLALPTFWFALLLKQLAVRFNKDVGHRVFGTIGDKSLEVPSGFFGGLGDLAGHLILPTITLALISYASWSRFERASMLEVLGSDYIRLARSKGLSKTRVMVRHALRTALIPLTTIMAIDFAALISGAVITEQIFQWHALGEFGTNGIRMQDTDVVAAWLLISAVAVITFNLIADLLYAVLDPRIRYA